MIGKTTPDFSNDWKSLDHAHVWHPYTRRSTADRSDFPVIVRGEGIHLVDGDGRRYVDAISSWWCCALGHGRPEVVEAIRRQALDLQHSILGHLTHPNAVSLAARLAHRMPTPDRHVLFASDGSSAVEQALKICLQYWANRGDTRRQRFACLAGAYHGDTLGAMGVGYVEAFHRPFRPVLAEAIAIPFPGAAVQMPDALADEIAAVIVEPLCLGAAGMKMYGPERLAEIEAWCRARGIPLIVDEIAMGMGRTGRWFAFEHAGVDPDIVCLGKALTAGYLPLSATIVRDSIYQTFTDEHTLQHGHTFCGNPIAAAAALATLDVFERDSIVERARQTGERLRELAEPLRSLKGVVDVRCLGLLAAVELVPVEGRPRRIREALLRRGVLLRPIGDVVYVMPPLTITELELAHLMAELRAALRETE